MIMEYTAKPTAPSPRVGSLNRRIPRVFQQPMMLVALAVIFVLLLIFVVYPVFMMLRESVYVDGQLSLGNYIRFFSSNYFLHTLYNTLVVSALVTVGAVALGVGAAMRGAR